MGSTPVVPQELPREEPIQHWLLGTFLWDLLLVAYSLLTNLPAPVFASELAADGVWGSWLRWAAPLCLLGMLLVAHAVEKNHAKWEKWKSDIGLKSRHDTLSNQLKDVQGKLDIFLALDQNKIAADVTQTALPEASFKVGTNLAVGAVTGSLPATPEPIAQKIKKLQPHFALATGSDSPDVTLYTTVAHVIQNPPTDPKEMMAKAREISDQLAALSQMPRALPEINVELEHRPRPESKLQFEMLAGDWLLRVDNAGGNAKFRAYAEVSHVKGLRSEGQQGRHCLLWDRRDETQTTIMSGTDDSLLLFAHTRLPNSKRPDSIELRAVREKTGEQYSAYQIWPNEEETDTEMQVTITITSDPPMEGGPWVDRLAISANGLRWVRE